MKRISEKQRLRHIRLIRLRKKKNNRRISPSAGHGQAKIARDRFRTARSKLPSVTLEYDRHPGYASFIPPSVFSLSDNFKETLAFIYDFKSYFSRRKKLKCPDGVLRYIYAEFSEIERIGAGAGLVLAAEIHRYAQTRVGKVTIHDQLWNESVRNYFNETGLFDLLGIDPQTIQSRHGNSSSRETLKYICGRTSSGRQVKLLRERLQELAGRPLGSKVGVYNAIAEALANVDHAYPNWFRSWPYPSARQWWTSGFWDKSSKTVGLQLYDSGAGIPTTLPRQSHWPKLLKRLEPERTDAGLIAAAMEYGRTSTDEQGRGRGLSEMADWIESSGSGFLKILSGRGEVTYRPGKQITRRNRDANFDGTLVQWELCLAD